MLPAAEQMASLLRRTLVKLNINDHVERSEMPALTPRPTASFKLGSYFLIGL